TTTSRRLSRRSTAARSVPRSAFSRPPSPYAAPSSAPGTDASPTTCTARPSADSATRSSSARRLRPLPGSPHSTTSGIPSRGRRRERTRGSNFRGGPEARAG
uniref:Uncharacterized protein n=1 Tax=Jaculus jaculus TaxID=51337 RepID=A0A8C5NZ70_JACJA